ncbi:Non-repetitive/WGA-negative nucleoporin C-terminal-domain-containing protein [Xylogone sp. PMI_703]|nr:Non-repetitive/WGA-negative nucleoporin C-terminal-domain-containing protein [Xylogone sp. PMI_703]
MFSPSFNGAPQAPVRSSRRRPRPVSGEGSVAQPKAKRQRSALSDQTFTTPNDAPEVEEVKAAKAPSAKHDSSREAGLSRREIVVRGKKAQPGDRTSKGDGSVILTTNDTYTVSKLPALPDRLRTDAIGHQHGAIFSENGYALALTHTHAVVWPYAVNTPSPETFTFTLPYPSKHISDPLPLGTLVSASASNPDPGLVVIIPTSGKITYWESIASAATLDLIREQRNGIESSIQGILSGERVIHILNAESAGFILGFSSGRTAFMSIRDGQGRPAISVQFLKGSPGSIAGGLFGSLRNVLSNSGSRGDITAIKAERTEKIGERNVVLTTSKGKIQCWDIQRGGHSSLRTEIDAREEIVGVIKEIEPSCSDLLLESFELLDFEFTPTLSAGSRFTSIGNEDSEVSLLLLVSLTGREIAHYALVEVTIRPQDFTIGAVRPINAYKTPTNAGATSKPHLYLPRPGLMAFLIFDRAVVVMSIAKQPDTPNSQLLTESHVPQQGFEDVIDFRKDLNVEIIGTGMEEPHGPLHSADESKSRRFKAKYPAVVLIVRNGGVLRIAATDTKRLTSINAQQVTAKSKLEQAVFFGTLDNNPLSFGVRSELEFGADEVGSAALELSNDILRSATPYIPSVPASIDQNLRKRSAALHDLACHLKSTGVALDRVTRWRLLWDAEKMKAATLIWKSYDARIKTKPDGQKRDLLLDLVEYIHEDFKSNPVPEAGELDRVRHWFIHDIWRIEDAVPWAYQVVKYTYSDGRKDHSSVLQTIAEANDVVIGALEGAFSFRVDNLGLYGLENERLEYGILKERYEGLPVFWTSTIYIVENMRKQAELTGILMKEFWHKLGDGQPDAAVVNKVRLDTPTLIDLSIRVSTERIYWDLAQGTSKFQMEAEQIKAIQAASQDGSINLLTEVDLVDEAISLAEKYEILPSLAAVLMGELDLLGLRIRSISLDSEDFTAFGRRAHALEELVNAEFTKFGKEWAEALYEYYVSNGSMRPLLDVGKDQQLFLTQFLRSKPEYSKLSWINDVTREKNFDLASKTLLDLGLRREQDVWSKKIELSLGRLAGLASQTHNQIEDFPASQEQLALIRIQEEIYNHIRPSIRDAIDDNAELQLALEAHGNKQLKRLRVFSSFLEEAMDKLIKHEAMDALTLIDLLTLMRNNGNTLDPFTGREFYLALEALHHGLLSNSEKALMSRVIWRRCYLRDDWAELNNTDLKDDQQVSDQLRQTALYNTFKACLKTRLFEKDTYVNPSSPQEVLGAGVTELDHRFHGLDASIRDSIMKDMQSEDDALKPFIETSRLEKWYHGTLDLAKQDFTEEVTEETDNGEKMRRMADQLKEIEASISEKEQQTASAILHSKPRFKMSVKTDYALGSSRHSSRLLK